MIKSSRERGGGALLSEFKLYRILYFVRAKGSARAPGAPSLDTPLSVGQTKEFVRLHIQPPRSKIPRFSLESRNSKMYSYHICMNYVHDSV